MAENRFGDEALPIGAKNGCLTIIGDFEEYEKIKDELSSVHYKTGAYSLYIGAALFQVLEFLEDRYA